MQTIMAEMIALHIGFQERIGQVSCLAAPFLEVGDQVRIYERQTSEVNVHLVKSINFTHDLDSGAYNMSLTTNWLATGRDTGDIVGAEILPENSVLLSRVESGDYGKLSRGSGSGI